MKEQLGGQNISLDWDTTCSQIETRVDELLRSALEVTGGCLSNLPKYTTLCESLWLLLNSPMGGYFLPGDDRHCGLGTQEKSMNGDEKPLIKSYLLPCLFLLEDSGRSCSLWSPLLFCVLLA